MVSRKQFWTDIKDALVNASISYNNNTVSIKASYNDDDLTQGDAPFVTVRPADEEKTRDRFPASSSGENTITSQIYVFASTTLALDDVTEQVTDALPESASTATFKNASVDYAFSPSNEVKFHSNTVSAEYLEK